ncbi:MAG TPA: aldose 1-epimerase family protein [Cryobacterium sp.]|nr:aldose 1-epimerase family protein [Cryobacterium sp.]
MRAATGFQYDLRAATPSGPALAIVTEVAAGLRLYSVDGIDLVEPFTADATPPWGAGIVLMPWPNRIRDGLWQHEGVVQRLALTEPELFNAIHGLLRYSPYRMLERSPSSVTLAATVFPQAGYPFQLDTTVRYALSDAGLDVTHTVRNVGRHPAPVALGAHPYLKIGGVPTEDLVLTIAAHTHVDVDDRQNPVGESSVVGTRFDLRAGRRVGDIDLDDGFGGVGPESLEEIPDTAGEEPGTSVASLTAPDGRSVTIWGDRNIRNVQVFTPRNFPFEGENGPFLGLAVAIEPMTAPANAFNSGAGLCWVDPGESWSVRWGIRHAGFGL